ncbi:uncharacterized protein LACBIDRAFT_299809 [Laccaria bicolor S238N-H82]|uniref:Predicted protein n=1 Tax=Laccaria bicolor (strain S238N-H82 / ATCC MYA-4686) TaxID=486041 RepID=B0DFG9_LACBS|nr:uncharacterized protein LACBIDRAFT_299809 [Laccaria bicolor S238N-H82]EDR06860.1 predicted protein [Laccaria bicolor S238N-H82]|eukprot:XP_001882707.1 predicted protein [Laccaria bicolor S238N-H82]
MAFGRLYQDILIRGHPHSPSFCFIKQISHRSTRLLASLVAIDLTYLVFISPAF